MIWRRGHDPSGALMGGGIRMEGAERLEDDSVLYRLAWGGPRLCRPVQAGPNRWPRRAQAKAWAA